MSASGLDEWIAATRSDWGPLSTEVVGDCQRNLADLVTSPATEPWLAALHRDAPLSQELYRDPDSGFVLLAHTEQAGLYRPPHDHGRGWVIYAVQQGEIEMGSYSRIEGTDGRFELVRRGSTLLRPGMVQVYLPGDIHDTRCITGPALLLRFTERDLKREERQFHRIARYVKHGDAWVAEYA